MEKIKFILGPNQQKAIAALKSGEYTQGHGALGCVIDGKERNCCLGVFARVFGCARTEPATEGGYIAYDDQRTIAPQSVIDALALYSPGGDSYDWLFNVAFRSSLVGINDANQNDFKTVIEALETFPEQYFKEPR